MDVCTRLVVAVLYELPSSSASEWDDYAGATHSCDERDKPERVYVRNRCELLDRIGIGGRQVGLAERFREWGEPDDYADADPFGKQWNVTSGAANIK